MIAVSQHFSFMEALEPAARERLTAGSNPLRASAGDRLFCAGGRVPGLAFLDTGVIRVMRPLQAGRSILLYRVMPGESCVISLASVLSDVRSPASAFVERDISGVFVPRDVAQELIRSSTTFREYAFGALGERLGDVIRLIDEIATQTLEQRLAACLLRKPEPIEITHRELAEELGSVREVVSRILDDFRRRGLLKTRRGLIEIIARNEIEEISRSG